MSTKDNKKTAKATKKPAKKSGTTTKPQLQTAADQSAKVTPITAANKGAAKAKGQGKGKNFLFSIPSQHTPNMSEYEHLVIASTKEEAARILADHRVQEKRPDLKEHPARASLVSEVAKGYMMRPIAQIEPRKEKAMVVQVNHSKMGSTPSTLH